MSFLCGLVDVEKATPKSSIRNIEIKGCLFDIYFDAIALLMEKAVATLFEKLFSLCTHAVKQKRWPDWGLNPGPSRHIPDALTTELSGLYQQIN